MADLVTLPQIIKAINNKNVLLPHFQREYVWNQTQQKNLILSVLTNLPSSSSLILKKQSTDVYKCLKIGMRNEEITDFGEGDCYYLLDGQQRYTTLYYAFHNIFKFKKEKNISEFGKIDNKLKKRWYLNFQNNGDSTLNFDNLIFQKANTNDLLPEDIDSFIEFENLKISDLKDHEKDFEIVEEKCKSEKKIPLFFFIEHKIELKRILKKIFDDRIDEIKSKKQNLTTLVQILESKGLSDSKEKAKRYYNNESSIINEINIFIDDKGYKDEWVDGIFDHFHDTLKNYEIQPIRMEDRNKAVKTFEYINTGGTNLSSFDLLCAKIGDFDLRKKVIEETKKEFKFFKEDFNKNNSFKLLADFGLIGGNDKNPSVEKRYAEYLSQVLNLIHFKEIKSKNPCNKEFSARLLKSNYSLDELDPEFIKKYYTKAVRVIKNSVALLQVFCAHKNLNSITNYLSLVQIFIFFVYCEKSSFQKEQLKKLIGQFWLKLFIGRYDSHQSEHAIEDAKDTYRMLFENDASVLEIYNHNINSDLLCKEGFATKELLTSRKCSKSLENNLFMVLRSFGSKFLDLDQDASIIEIEDEIEIHHILPISNATKVGDSTREIRKNDDHLLNATMNKTPIRKSTNGLISNKNIHQYCHDLKKFNTQFSHHFINSSWAENSYTEKNVDKIKELFEIRFDSLSGEIRKRIYSYINE